MNLSEWSPPGRDFGDPRVRLNVNQDNDCRDVVFVWLIANLFCHLEDVPMVG